MENIRQLGFLVPIIVFMALYSGIADIAISKKMKIAGVALAILGVAVAMTHSLNDNIVRNVLIFFLFLFFLPYSIGTWIAKIKNRIRRK